jgi:hypothetical protein
MAIFVTLKPGHTAQKLHDAILKEIHDSRIDTWKYNSNTGFVHTGESHNRQQWNQGAYLAYSEPIEATDTVLKLYYQLIPGSTITADTYGTLNGRFGGMLMNHFKSHIQSIQLVDLRTA